MGSIPSWRVTRNPGAPGEATPRVPFFGQAYLPKLGRVDLLGIWADSLGELFASKADDSLSLVMRNVELADRYRKGESISCALDKKQKPKAFSPRHSVGHWTRRDQIPGPQRSNNVIFALA